MSSSPILTLSPGLPFALAAELLTEIEAVLERYGAQRIRIDPASWATAVLAELPVASSPIVDVEPAGEVEPAGVVEAGVGSHS
ncbi:hypothetical protein ASC77_02795 [Nocardioides sp. Root1257]|uniref:hypothetical protein n=1 Tax=unclassified Nocardioides TaxID=2615069 RepID=UPI0006F71C12|nr:MULTISPECIES: hypothetical protein [unclassified Nocardioides]KQW53238.1 hypothetical protein ASC77_02795 [Nocardioides sp. Root1257]KRC55924.1 hypothetical protein ASE24_02795 [Nocardioides sp. Root224]